jgi:hypothetical protein
VEDAKEIKEIVTEILKMIVEQKKSYSEAHKILRTAMSELDNLKLTC